MCAVIDVEPLYRVPRTHKDIQHPFKLLREIIKRLPCSGNLFTSQSPFFPVFLFGVAAVTPEDRGIVSHWFDTIVSRASGRSVSCPLKMNNSVLIA
jgi:hypothetical protein